MFPNQLPHFESARRTVTPEREKHQFGYKDNGEKFKNRLIFVDWFANMYGIKKCIPSGY